MFETKEEVIEYVTSQDVRFIRLAFFDLFGTQKNVSIVPSHIESAFENGVAIDASLVSGFDEEPLDLFLVPDPSTFTILPWRSVDGRVVFMICDIQTADGKPYPFDARYQLKEIIRLLNQNDLEPLIASKLQFTLFKEVNGLRELHDQGTYLDVSPEDQAENLRRQIMLTLEEMGCSPYKSFHQRGAGQNEIDLRFTQALRAADEVALLRWITRTLAVAQGLEADFAPLPGQSRAHNSLQVQIKFFDHDPKTQKAFLGGLIEHIPQIFFFLNPFKDSYFRFRDQLAASELLWSKKRYSALRIPPKHEDLIEVRLADPRMNPYVLFSLLFLAGLDGVLKERVPLKEDETAGDLPRSLNKAYEESLQLDQEVFSPLESILKALWRGYER